MAKLDYQEDAIRKLLDRSFDLLSKEIESPSIVFESPTGSGKTFMSAEFIKRISDDSKSNLCFLWVAPRSLHVQSYKKLKNHFSKFNFLRCIYFHEVQERMLKKGDILFMNWESINKKDNIIYRENETNFYLNNVIERTKEKGLKIILIIDESHHSLKSEISQRLTKEIQADLSIAISATPKNINENDRVMVFRKEVIDEEMIKKSVVINEGFKNEIIKETEEGSIEFRTDAVQETNNFVIDKALKKRNSLSKLYSEINSKVNPLLLIQLPDSKAHQTEDLKDNIIKILNEHDITFENGKLAIWLSDHKESLNNLEKNENPVEVLIFKQAPALGWDCPRASIILTLRDWKKYDFSIQTLGRIMRMPERKHYIDDVLNHGYVFTSSSSLKIHHEVSNGYTALFNSIIKKSINKELWKNVKLKSFHKRRQRERTRLNLDFLGIFLESAKKLDSKKNINIDDDEVNMNLFTDTIIQDPDTELEISASMNRGIPATELQLFFDEFIADNMGQFYPEERSVKRINDSIYKLFKEEFGFDFSKNFETFKSSSGENISMPYFDESQFLNGNLYVNREKVQRIVMSKSNSDFFKYLIEYSISQYILDVTAKGIIFDENDYLFKESINYSNQYTEKNYNLSLMDPYYELTNSSSIEKDFAKWINKNSDKVEFFHKNGDSGETNFSVKKSDNTGSFYVDWIIKFKDGSLGLYDTKSGWTAEDSFTRSKGLNDYIKEENKKGKKLKGGIVIPWVNAGKWLVYEGDNYFYKDGTSISELLSNHGWKDLIF